MALSRQPVSRVKKEEINRVIEKGGSIPVDDAIPNHEIKRVQLRIPISLIQEIDHSLAKRPVKVSRHVWFLEAISEKLR
jgi:hypothetical protein